MLCSCLEDTTMCNKLVHKQLEVSATEAVIISINRPGHLHFTILYLHIRQYSEYTFTRLCIVVYSMSCPKNFDNFQSFNSWMDQSDNVSYKSSRAYGAYNKFPHVTWLLVSLFFMSISLTMFNLGRDDICYYWLLSPTVTSVITYSIFYAPSTQETRFVSVTGVQNIYTTTVAALIWHHCRYLLKIGVILEPVTLSIGWYKLCLRHSSWITLYGKI